ncbi:hypothetical protein PY254_12860 [Rhodanobacter sp. AS-Z3]|uniref:hypothetical protein n=1 Tax=Rhodanobacter sp. AS-Z3 TaxID=3031330 RepID=UPI00247A7E60|nr:hypothetical protein [Rhodanobacter sp. AS-Z3]WEN14124.1 hypothetical protein PY254_12860 [Rhodanobacter sp. AS-Z3]
MTHLLYPTLLFAHLLLFVLWLGADVGVYLLGQHFRKRERYTLDQRLALLRLLVEVDMVPRTAWALMVPISLSLVTVGRYWIVPGWGLALAWMVGAIWIALVWDAHAHDQTPRAARDRRIESVLRYALAIFYLGLGLVSLWRGAPLAPHWLATKALMFGVIFAAAIMIDVRFRPVGPQLLKLIREGSSDATEVPLLRTMNRTRIWVWIVYLMLLATAWLGVVKPF